MANPVIKQATAADIPVITQIIEATWEPTYRHIIPAEQIRYMQQEIYAPASLAKQLQENQIFFILYQEGQPAGFASYSQYSPDTFKLNKIYLHPAYQGLGLGKSLIKHIEQEACRRGGTYLILNVNRHNQAKHFYEKQGYAVLKTEDIPIGAYWMNDYVLQKKL